MNLDHNRFSKIVKGIIRRNLKGYLGKTDLFGKIGDKYVTIPVPQIDLPRFRFGENGGVGIGDGKPGDALGPGSEGGEEKSAGSNAGDHTLEVEISLEELADLLGNELGLPNIEPKGEDKIISEKYKVKGIASTGPATLRSFSRGYKRALKRQISEGAYDHLKPSVVPIREDMRYKALERAPSPQSSAVIIYMMDVSGSMGEEEKYFVRTTSFWLSAWIQKFYKEVEERYIIHDIAAKEVDRKTFFQTKESGGTLFVPVYSFCLDMIARDYDPQAYNIYPFHFSDGDNFPGEDSSKAFGILEKHLLPAVNMFGYGQCKSSGRDEGKFLRELKKHFHLERETAKLEGKVRVATLYKKEEIADALFHFLKTGR